MRRLSLSAKLFVAALPLLVAVGALLALSIRDNLDEVSEARRGAQLGSTWEPLIAAIQAIESEQTISDAGDQTAIVDARRATDSSMTDLRGVVREVGDSDAMVVKIGTATSSISTGRVAVDSGDAFQVIAAVRAYDTAERELIGLGRLLPAEADDAELGRTLLAVASLAATEQTANDIVQSIGDWPESGDPSGVVQAALLGDAMVATVDEFENVAPDAWLTEFREGRWARRLADSMNRLDGIVVAADRGAFVTFDATEFNDTIAGIAGIRDQLAQQIVTDAEARADALQQESFIRIGITLVALILAGLMAWFLTRSITRRVRAVSDKAHEVATTQLPALVGALRDPRGRAAIPDVAPIEDVGTDELGELAGAFNVVQSTLVDVAHEQVEVLRRGVSDIFVTMARRTRSLIDRQLALLDELEADVDDPDVLANYYRLDHLATRMRRNSESLLVLANTETRRRRTKATEIDDVVRAAIGEVEDYRRIDVLNLDHLQVRGTVVADISHLLAELLDNASSFSPPESRVRVSGRYAGEHYLISIADDGVGIGAERLAELNEILTHPPIVGLSVEPTLGMSVVSLLAHKHGVEVRLVPSSPGLLVEVVLPAAVYGPIDATGTLGLEPAQGAPSSNGHARVAPDSLVEWKGASPGNTDTFVPDEVRVEPPAEPTYAPEPTYEVEPTYEAEPTYAPEPTYQAEPAVQADWAAEQEWSIIPEWATEPQPATDRQPEPERAPDEPPSPVQPVAEHDSTGLTPPLSHDRLSGEFDRPPAPPAFGTQPTSRPFTDPTARPLPARRTEPERAATTGTSSQTLPTRDRGTGPEGPDRLAPLGGPVGQPTDRPVAPTAPGSLKAALTAFESGRAGTRPDVQSTSPSLPTRDPGNAFDHEAVTPSTSQSRLDPEAIRERLRSFQQEFQLGRDGDVAPGHDGDQTDLGGDR
ncbi:MAG: ATP-binding protein [Ilumatobacteraceae bacterium]